MEDDDNFGERNGFFKTYHISVLKKLSRDDLAALSACQTDQERLVCVHSLPYVHQVPDVVLSAMSKPMPNAKSATEAQKKRTKGNEAFKLKDYKRAVQLYSEAILKAPVISDGYKEAELAMAFANRSAALVHLADYQRALVDIDQALANGYPAELRYKLSERQAKCWIALKMPTEQILQACQSALEGVKESSLDGVKRTQFERDIKLLIEHSSNGLNDPALHMQQIEVLYKPKQLPEVVGGRSTEHHSLSSKIRIEEDPALGRYGVAGAAIRVGEVLAVDVPYASVMNPEKYLTHCQHCYRPLSLGESLPCPTCSGVVFCSVSCRTEALDTYHAIECPLLDCLFAAGISITCYLSLRMLALKPLSFYMNTKTAIERPELQDEMELDQESKKYLRTYHLVTHGDRRNKESFFHVTLMADFLLKCLKMANYFGVFQPIESNFSGPLSEQERWIGSLLLRHIQLLQFNAHEVSELQMERPGCMDRAKTLFLGAAVYPTVSLFNHSCEPSVVRYCIGVVMVVRAMKTIGQGEPINENYGPIFTQKRKTERQRILKERYWFDCRCQPCVEDWPPINEMTNDALRFRCSERRCRKPLVVPVDTMTPFITCPSCKKGNNILKSLQTLQETEGSFLRGSELISSGNFDEALEYCIKTLTKLDEILCPPYRDYVQCQEGARRCILTKGNVIYTS